MKKYENMVFQQFSSYISTESHMHKLANSTNLRIHQRKSQLDAWNKQGCPVICLGGIKNMKTWRIFLLYSTLLLSSPFISFHLLSSPFICFFGSFGVLRLNQSCQIHNSRRFHLSPQDSTTRSMVKTYDLYIPGQYENFAEQATEAGD